MKERLLSILLSTLVLTALAAEEPVHFADTAFKTAVEEALWIADPTPTDMLGLITLTAIDAGIATLAGLEYAANLQELDLRGNQIGSISPLAGLTLLRIVIVNNNQIANVPSLSGLSDLERLDIHHSNIGDASGLSGLDSLRQLNIHDNHVSDISPLGGLTSLRVLVICQNQISDISPLSKLATLKELDLSENQIADISPLGALTSLTRLDLRANPLNQEAYDVYIPQIVSNNPGVDLQCLLDVSVSCGEGGSVPVPGEGQFAYKYNDVVCLTAQADPGFVFTHWSGTLYSTQNPYYLSVRSEHQITANFASASGMLAAGGDYIHVCSGTPHRITGTQAGEVSAGYSSLGAVETGPGCIGADPLFARTGYWVDRDDPTIRLGADDPNAIWVMGDYHLQSEAGRWDPEKGAWAQDAVTSSCIDAGDPSGPVGQEPSPNGGIINIGVYGGTTEASKSPVNR